MKMIYLLAGAVFLASGLALSSAGRESTPSITPEPAAAAPGLGKAAMPPPPVEPQYDTSQPPANPHGATGLPQGHPPTTAATKDVPIGNVDKAEGPNGLRIDELFAQKDRFAGKAVRVRGVVVKATMGVMGKNFIHLRDGSGSDAKKDNDLTVTTTEVVERGQTVLLEGTVTLDKDLGAGYLYDILLEDAKPPK